MISTRLYPALALGLAGILAACAAFQDVEPLQVRLVDMEPMPSTLFEQRYRLHLRIANPNDTEVSLDGLTFNLELNGRDFAEGMTNQAVTVPRLGEARLAVPASTTLLDLVEQMRRLGQRTQLDYRISGTAYLKGLARRSMPYEQAGSLSLSGGMDAPPGPETRLQRLQRR